MIGRPEIHSIFDKWCHGTKFFLFIIMSGPIRILIGPALTRIRNLMEELDPVLTAQERTQEGIELLRKSLVKLRRSLTFLEEKNEYWRQYLVGLANEEKADEEQIYENFHQNNRHFGEYLVDAREMIGDIELILIDEDEKSSHGTNSEFSSELGFGQRNRNNRTQEAEQPEITHEVRKQQQNSERAENVVEIKGEAGGRINVLNVPPPYLPRARMPDFFGDPLSWPEFWQAFVRTVDNLNIDEGLKTHYLIQCMKGRARRSVLGYRAIAEHYAPLKDALIRQYGNEKAIQDSLHAELISLAPANESVGSLRHYLEDVERLCRSLIAMGQLQNEPIIMMAIKNKLPRSVVLELLKMEKSSGEFWDVTKLRDGLAEIVALREEAQRCTQSLYSRSGQQQQQQHYQHRGNWSNPRQRFNNARIEQGRVFAVNANQYKREGTERGRKCLFCQGEHWASMCQRVKNVAVREKFLNDQKRCLRCLRKGHNRKECPANFICKNCGSIEHHMVICSKNHGENKGE